MLTPAPIPLHHQPIQQEPRITVASSYPFFSPTRTPHTNVWVRQTGPDPARPRFRRPESSSALPSSIKSVRLRPVVRTKYCQQRHPPPRRKPAKFHPALDPSSSCLPAGDRAKDTQGFSHPLQSQPLSVFLRLSPIHPSPQRSGPPSPTKQKQRYLSAKNNTHNSQHRRPPTRHRSTPKRCDTKKKKKQKYVLARL